MVRFLACRVSTFVVCLVSFPMKIGGRICAIMHVERVISEYVARVHVY